MHNDLAYSLVCYSLIMATFIHLEAVSTWLFLEGMLGPKFLSMQIQSVNIFKSQEEILLSNQKP